MEIANHKGAKTLKNSFCYLNYISYLVLRLSAFAGEYFNLN